MVISVVLSLLPAPHAQAENLGPGGGTRVIAGDEIVGPYRLLFTSSPEPAQVGKVTLVVRLSDPKTDEKVRDAEAVIELKHSETGATLSQAATHANAGNPTDYAAHFELDQPGQWEGVLRVRGSAGSAELPFMQRISPKRQISTLVSPAPRFWWSWGCWPPSGSPAQARSKTLNCNLNRLTFRGNRARM